MATVTIYRITCTKAYVSSAELGERFSLSPWGSDTAHYEGYDDGGHDYELPAGFELAVSKSLSVEIYGPDGDHYALVGLGHTPQIVSANRSYLLKRAATRHATHYDADDVYAAAAAIPTS